MSEDVTALLGKLTELTGSMVDTIGQLDTATADRQRRKTCRNADAIARQFKRLEQMAEHISRMQFCDIYSFDHNSSVYLHPQAMGLIEWFYVLTEPRVSTRITTQVLSDKPSAHVWVNGELDGERMHVWCGFDSPEAVAMIEACSAPSVHLLRRLQIVGAR
ncbi:hypothetical protein [Kibdelosporangium phytohabitans]|uniref:Uncharacterized protein n=1 Tax=Kibdelosporangium phytohabitans TaxID=860235 RepID=A0A0N9HL70_9PSEU|nr:hypothetical protein [Kibdelosporangium phytohabitans]ALG06817.1 hypothetical protein AOZ06_07645 [Kibdelosporangium phytohabitans]MBE1468060.1 hypothetical protein [Kibdelosporangium phytohabitans]